MMIETDDPVTVIGYSGFLTTGYKVADEGPRMTCLTCRWWRSDPSGDVGACATSETEEPAVWARTTPDHFCADWEAS
jgi:hypothetical protein